MDNEMVMISMDEYKAIETVIFAAEAHLKGESCEPGLAQALNILELLRDFEFEQYQQSLYDENQLELFNNESE